MYMAMEYVYSNKDSNRNRKIEQRKTRFFKTLGLVIAIMAAVGGCYYYYTYTSRPPLISLGSTEAAVEQYIPVPHHHTEEAHPYKPDLPPFAQ
jgi:hypothetical protein